MAPSLPSRARCAVSAIKLAKRQVRHETATRPCADRTSGERIIYLVRTRPLEGGLVQVRLEIGNGYTVCRPVGVLDASTTLHLGEAMALMTSVPRLVINLSEVPFIDAAGLGALVGGIRRVREAGGEVAVCSSRPHVRRVLETIGVDRVVPLVETLEDAQAYLDPRPVHFAGVA